MIQLVVQVSTPSCNHFGCHGDEILSESRRIRHMSLAVKKQAVMLSCFNKI